MGYVISSCWRCSGLGWLQIALTILCLLWWRDLAFIILKTRASPTPLPCPFGPYLGDCRGACIWVTQLRHIPSICRILSMIISLTAVSAAAKALRLTALPGPGNSR